MLHFPVRQEQPVSAKKNTICPIDTAQPDWQFWSLQHASNLSRKDVAYIQPQSERRFYIFLNYKNALFPFFLVADSLGVK